MTNPLGLYWHLDAESEKTVRDLLGTIKEKNPENLLRIINSINSRGWNIRNRVIPPEEGWKIIKEYYNALNREGMSLLHHLVTNIIIPDSPNFESFSLKLRNNTPPLPEDKRDKFAETYNDSRSNKKLILNPGKISRRPDIRNRYYVTSGHCPNNLDTVLFNRWRLTKEDLLKARGLEHLLAYDKRSQLHCYSCAETHQPGAGWIQYESEEFQKYNNILARLEDLDREIEALRNDVRKPQRNRKKKENHEKIASLERKRRSLEKKLLKLEEDMRSESIIAVNTRIKGPDSLADKIADYIAGVKYPRKKPGKYHPNMIKDVYGLRVIVSDERVRDNILAKLFLLSEYSQSSDEVNFRMVRENFYDFWTNPKLDDGGNPTFSGVKFIIEYYRIPVEVQIMTLEGHRLDKRTRRFFKEEVRFKRQELEQSGIPWNKIRDGLVEAFEGYKEL